jgi:hypothetical protein
MRALFSALYERSLIKKSVLIAGESVLAMGLAFLWLYDTGSREGKCLSLSNKYVYRVFFCCPSALEDCYML